MLNSRQQRNETFWKKFILFSCIFLIYFTAFSQNQSVRIKGRDITIKAAFEQIEKQTGLTIAYDESVLNVNQRIKGEITSAKLSDALSEILRGTKSEILFQNKHVVIRPAKPQSKPTNNSTKNQSLDNKLKTITGKVTDAETREPIIGVSITVQEDNKIGTITNFDGNFILDVPYNASLLFTYIGYEPLTVKVDKDVLNVILESSNMLLNEVVAIGYGQQKKVSVTGAISAIGTKELKQTPTANISNALAGRLTGLTALQYSGEPGSDGAKIYIRGASTFQGSTDPLVIVDGIERGFSNIDPNEIESISILKDASATAVYGVRGANGVVIVTTKRGSPGKPGVNVNLQTAMLSPTRMGDYLTSYDALLLYREGLKNDGLNYSMYTDEYINKFQDRKNPTYQYLYPSVDWRNELLKTFSNQTQANITISGGSESVRYFISTSYLNQDGMYKHANDNDYSTQVNLERYNFRSNLDIDLSRKLKVFLNLGGIVWSRNLPGSSIENIWNAIQQTPSFWYPMLNPDGSIAESHGKLPNPYAILTQSGYVKQHFTTLNSSMGGTWDMSDIVKGLSASAKLSFDITNYRNVGRYKSYKSFTFSIDENETDLSKGTYASVRDDDTSLGYTVDANGNRTSNLELYFNYNRKFSFHNVSALVLYNQQNIFTNAYSGTSNAVYGLPYRRQGLVGRITYDYKGKYFSELNMGYNGSENFMKGKRFGFFPAVSVSWLISQEQFIKETMPYLDILKLRASYGEVGNDQIGGMRFMYLSTWQTDMYGYHFGSSRNGFYLGGAQESTVGNQKVTWERAKKTNLGVDLNLWNSKLKFSSDFFYEYRDNILTIPLIISDIAGVKNLPMINAGIVENKGFELELEHRQTFKKWNYFVKANISYAKNKILEKAEPDYTGREWQQGKGRMIGEFYGYKSLGLFRSWDEIANSPVQNGGEVQPGDIKYADLNNDNVIDALDAGYLGKSSIPDKVFGISFGGAYKDFDFSILCQGTDGGYVWYGGVRIWPFARFSNVLADVKGKYWSEDNDAEQNAKAKYPRMVSDSNPNNYCETDFWLKPTHYLRLKNLEIGYNLPKVLTNRLGAQKIRFYLSGVNLLTFDEIKIFDPEMPNGSGNYPQQKIYNAGVSITF